MGLHKHGNRRWWGLPHRAARPFKQFSICAARWFWVRPAGPFEAYCAERAVGCSDFQNANFATTPRRDG